MFTTRTDEVGRHQQTEIMEKLTELAQKAPSIGCVPMEEVVSAIESVGAATILHIGPNAPEKSFNLTERDLIAKDLRERVYPAIEEALGTLGAEMGKKFTKGEFVSIYGHDLPREGVLNIASVVQLFANEFKQPVIGCAFTPADDQERAALMNEVVGHGNPDAFITCSVDCGFPPKDANGEILYGGIVRGDPVGLTKNYLGGESRELKLQADVVVVYSQDESLSEIAHQEVEYAKRHMLSVFHVKMTDLKA